MRTFGGTCLTLYRSQPIPEKPRNQPISLGKNVPNGTYRTAIKTPQGTVIMYPKQSASAQSITNGLWTLDTDNLETSEINQLVSGNGDYVFMLLDQNNTPTTVTAPQGTETLNGWLVSFLPDYEGNAEPIGNDEIFMIATECVC